MESADNDALTLRFLRQGKIRAALDRAKKVNKARPTQENEALLLRCHVARAGELRSGGRNNDADALDAHIEGHFPPEAVRSAREAEARSREPNQDRVTVREKTAAGDPLGDAIVRLAAAGASENDISDAEATIARHAFDPVALAGHPAMTPDHPLAAAANAVAAAFSAAVSRPVTDAEISLPQIPRRGPLAGWKLLIRCIAHLQRREDMAAARALDALAAMECAPARLVPALRRFLTTSWDGVDNAARRIFSAWRPGEKRLPAVLARLDEAVGKLQPRGAFGTVQPAAMKKLRLNCFAAIREADAAMLREKPAAIEHFRALTVAKAIIADGVPLPEIEKNFSRQPVRTASFWRLAALAMEVRINILDDERMLPAVCGAWNAFRRHGVAENLFPAGGPEEAEVYLHLAALMAEQPPRPGRMAAREAFALSPEYCYGDGQAEAVRALAPAPGEPPLPQNAMALYALAAKSCPTVEVFRAWLDGARRFDGYGGWRRKGDSGDVERVLREWCAALPGDPAPRLFLMNAAEERDALTLAQKHLAEAEAIDPLNADLTRAKWRLALAMCRRHLKQGKAHLVETDIGKLDALRRHGPKDADWLLAALRWAVAAVIPGMAGRLHGELAALAGGGDAGECAAALLEVMVLFASNNSLFPEELPNPQPPAGATELVAGAAVRAVKLAAAAGFAGGWGEKSKWPQWFVRAANLLPAGDMPLLAEFMLPGKHYNEAFILTAAGLASAAKTASAGRLLYIRGLAVMRMKTYQSVRVRQCLRAALEIGRRENDGRIVAAVSALARKEAESFRFPFDTDDYLMPMRDDELDEVIRIERENATPPAGRGENPHRAAKYRRKQEWEDGVPDGDNDDDASGPGCQCPECRRRRGEAPPGVEEIDTLSGVPPELKREAIEFLENAGTEYLEEISPILDAMGFSSPTAKRLKSILVPALLLAELQGEDCGNGFFDFLHKNTRVREEIMAIADTFPPADRRIIEEGYRLAAAQRASRPGKRTKARRRSRR